MYDVKTRYIIYMINITISKHARYYKYDVRALVRLDSEYIFKNEELHILIIKEMK